METVKYLQEFLVKDYDFTSPMSQHGIKAEKITLMNKKPPCKKRTDLYLSIEVFIRNILLIFLNVCESYESVLDIFCSL
jgi:hypothetical protein